MIVVNANDLARTRLCQAAGCEHDAEPHSALCDHCQRRRSRGARITLHEPPAHTGDLLRCNGCEEWKPDDSFSFQTSRSEGLRHQRRGRHTECRECNRRRRTAERERRGPLTHCAGITPPPRQGTEPRPCKAYPVPGSIYCASHGGRTA